MALSSGQLPTAPQGAFNDVWGYLHKWQAASLAGKGQGADKHPARWKTVPATKNHPVQSVRSAGFETPSSHCIYLLFPCTFSYFPVLIWFYFLKTWVFFCNFHKILLMHFGNWFMCKPFLNTQVQISFLLKTKNFFWLCPQHAKFPGPGVDPTPPQRPMTQHWQHGSLTFWTTRELPDFIL